MSWTDQGGNPECKCGHLWSNHYNKDQGGILGMYFCEAPECICTTFEEITTMDRLANSIFQLEESEVVETCQFDFIEDNEWHCNIHEAEPVYCEIKYEQLGKKEILDLKGDTSHE